MRSASAEALWDLYSTSFGPIKTSLETLNDDRRRQYRVDGGISALRENMVILGTRRGSEPATAPPRAG